MAFLFRKAKKAQGAQASPNAAIERLRATLDMIEKRETYLHKKAENELAEAKRNAMRNKRAALFALKKKRVYEAQAEKLAGAKMTIETQILHLEQVSITSEAFSAMASGAAAMKDMQNSMTLEQVDNTMDAIQEQMDVANEIADAISQPVGVGLDIDETELEAELDQLAQQNVDEQLLGVPSVPAQVPAAPSTATAAAAPARKQAVTVDTGTGVAGAAALHADADDDEFRRLAADMAA